MRDVATIATACFNLVKKGGGGRNVACNYHYICVKNSVQRVSGQTPPWADTPWKHTPLEGDTPWEGDNPWKQIPQEADTPQKQTPPGSRHPTPQKQCMLEDMGNKQAVHILLECILVFDLYLQGACPPAPLDLLLVSSLQHFNFNTCDVILETKQKHDMVVVVVLNETKRWSDFWSHLL